jgi:hypothetical protein
MSIACSASRRDKTIFSAAAARYLPQRTDRDATRAPGSGFPNDLEKRSFSCINLQRCEVFVRVLSDRAGWNRFINGNKIPTTGESNRVGQWSIAQRDPPECLDLWVVLR